MTPICKIIIMLFILCVSLAFFIGYTEYYENNNGINKVNGIVYINLENRNDRKELLLKELKELNTDMSKVNKVSGILIPKNGHKGCVQAHILSLNLAKLNKWNKTLILEDDAQLNVPPEDFNKIVNIVFEKLKDIQWDVIMLATAYKIYDENVKPIPFSIKSVEKNLQQKHVKSFNIKKLKTATTGSAYIIKNTYVDTLLNLLNTCNDSMQHHKLSDNNYEINAFDQKWKQLQEKDNWYCLDEDPMKQRAIWSTILTNSHQ
jgi:hypothetical protein